MQYLFKILLNQTTEKGPEESEWKVPEGYYFSPSKRYGRKLLTIPAVVVQAVGGKDKISQEIYAAVFSRAIAPWGSYLENGGYIVELDTSTDQQKLSVFIERIEAEAKKNQQRRKEKLADMRLLIEAKSLNTQRSVSRKGFLTFLTRIFGK